MAEALRVVGGTLLSMAGRLDGAAGLLDNKVSGLSGHESDVGASNVRDAAARFERRWGDGRTRVREQAERLAQTLRDSVAAYDGSESEVSSALDQGPGR